MSASALAPQNHCFNQIGHLKFSIEIQLGFVSLRNLHTGKMIDKIIEIKKKQSKSSR